MVCPNCSMVFFGGCTPFLLDLTIPVAFGVSMARLPYGSDRRNRFRSWTVEDKTQSGSHMTPPKTEGFFDVYLNVAIVRCHLDPFRPSGESRLFLCLVFRSIRGVTTGCVRVSARAEGCESTA